MLYILEPILLKKRILPWNKNTKSMALNLDFRYKLFSFLLMTVHWRSSQLRIILNDPGFDTSETFFLLKGWWSASTSCNMSVQISFHHSFFLWYRNPRDHLGTDILYVGDPYTNFPTQCLYQCSYIEDTELEFVLNNLANFVFHFCFQIFHILITKSFVLLKTYLYKTYSFPCKPQEALENIPLVLLLNFSN